MEFDEDAKPGNDEGPHDWGRTLAMIKRHRAEGPSAAVDTMGCEKIAELDNAAKAKAKGVRDSGSAADEAKYRRYLTLTSAMLSSQTRDEINHAAMLRLCAHGCTPENILNTEEDALDALINPVGFHRRKAQFLRRVAKILLDDYDGDIPRSVEALCALPGVGPKMAYLVMNVGWEEPTGICVDVHVHRIAERLGWTPTDAVGKNGSPRKKTPEDTRVWLEAWLPKEEWIEINPLLVGFGQLTCTPLRPKCHECPLAENGACPSAFKESSAPSTPKSASKRIKTEEP
jgi:endonuclease-3